MFKDGDTIKIEKELVITEFKKGLYMINNTVFSEDSLLALGAVKVRKSYTVNDLKKIYENCDKESVLMRALEAGEFYQGWTKWDLIAMAMGYRNHEGKINTWYKVGEE